MDNRLWFYVIIGVIFLISRILKKSDKQTGDIPEIPLPKNQSQGNRPLSQTTKPKQLTFEELLREISESKTVIQQQTRPAPKPAYVDYDDDIEEEEKNLETIPYDYRKDNKVYEAYEDAKNQAFQRPSLEETLKLKDTDVKFGRFKSFDTEEQRDLLEEYTRDFQDPEGFKKAFVMSEILKRRF
jgi:hypothetical protein